MEVKIGDPKTAAALKQDGSLRCLLKIRYRHRDRHSARAIAWARGKAEAVSRELLKGAGLPAEKANFTVSLNMITLERYGHSSYVCYDVYLEKCSMENRDKIDQSTWQPIHVISKSGNVLIARRTPKLDLHIAYHYDRFQHANKGPRPYFADLEENSLLYYWGQRLEEPGSKHAQKNVENDADGDGKNNRKEEDGELRPDQGREDGTGSGPPTAEAED